jgi:hypothetical protein
MSVDGSGQESDSNEAIANSKYRLSMSRAIFQTFAEPFFSKNNLTNRFSLRLS